MAWCQRDPDLLLSCGKDNRILCWNPNSSVPRGEVSENYLVGWGSAVLLFVGDGGIPKILNWACHIILKHMVHNYKINQLRLRNDV